MISEGSIFHFLTITLSSLTKTQSCFQFIPSNHIGLLVSCPWNVGNFSLKNIVRIIYYEYIFTGYTIRNSYKEIKLIKQFFFWVD